MSVTPRAPRLALLALSFLGLAVPALGQDVLAPAPATLVARPVQTADDPWLYKGSDIIQDAEWKFGRLSNGVRYAVRRNGVPPGQVSIRVRIDAGSLMEKDSERGYAHLLEHLSFRGSVHVPDGESKRIWQRFGVTFGSDSNASTTFTQTVYKLDLPNANAGSLDESFKILSGMMAGPTITAQSLNAERPVVLAEAREQPGAQKRLQDKMFDLMFSGQPLADREPIGTTEALVAATPESVLAFHQRWYRPERAVVIAVGDADPAILEQMVVKHFSAWKGEGAAQASPDFGKPVANAPTSTTIVESSVPTMAMMTVMRPWTVFSDTVIFNQERMVDLVAIRVMNRRLESRARTGASYLVAGANLDDVARSANVTTVQVQPVGDDWEAALKDVRAVIADVQANPPTQAEIDREVAEIDAGMKNSVDTWPVESASNFADNLVQAVDINETMTSADGSYAIFKDAVAKKMFNSAAVQKSAKRIFDGTATRVLLNLHAPDAKVAAKVTAVLSADVSGSVAARKALGDVSFAKLPALGPKGAVLTREAVLDSPKVEKITFANGVTLLLHEDRSEVSRVYVNVRFGRGLSAMPANRPTPGWAGQAALVASGIGDYGQEELDALTGQRTMGFGFAIDDDAFKFSGRTTAADLPDQLKLFATKLARPGWDPNPVNRAKVGILSSYAGMTASPDAVLNTELDGLLRSGDPRWATPARQNVSSLTPAQFRAFWEPLLATGPIEVQIFGDMNGEEAIKAMAGTFGALPKRPAAPAVTPPPAFPRHVVRPVVRTHTGQPDQAAAVIAWPTGGGSAGISESRKLDVLTAVFRDRLLDKLRSEAGVSYSPNVSSDWPVGLPTGGKVMALGLVPPDKTDFFFKLAREIAADLVAKPIDRDELNRALTPIKQLILRSSSGNMFWMRLVEGGSYDPARIAAVDSLARDIAYTTPEELQALAVKYLRPDKDWSMVVLPAKAGKGVAR